ncbi:hypothetical protein ACWENQ_43715 [Nonomuraea sp. NPDC004354]
MAGFVVTIAGIAVLLGLVAWKPGARAFAPGLLLIGLGLGVMLTPSVTVVQSCSGRRSPAVVLRETQPSCRPARVRWFTLIANRVAAADVERPPWPQRSAHVVH